MKNWSKRGLYGLAALCLCLVLLGTGALAAEGEAPPLPANSGLETRANGPGTLSAPSVSVDSGSLYHRITSGTKNEEKNSIQSSQFIQEKESIDNSDVTHMGNDTSGLNGLTVPKNVKGAWERARFSAEANGASLTLAPMGKDGSAELTRSAYIPFSVDIPVPAHTERTCTLPFTISYTNEDTVRVYAKVLPGTTVPDSFNLKAANNNEIAGVYSSAATGSGSGTYEVTLANDTDADTTETLNFLLFAGHGTTSWSKLNLSFTMTLDDISYTDVYTGSYDVTVNAANCSYEGGDEVQSGSEYSTIFHAEEGYALPENVTVTMGGATLTSGYTWSRGAGTLSIPNVSGDVVITVTAEALHPHAVCGAASCGHSGHSSVAYLPWDGTDSLSGGSYYLTEDVTLSADTHIDISGTVNLCLNGHTFDGDASDGLFRVQNGGTLNICDCSEEETGVLTVDEGNNPVILYGTGVLNLYSGAIRAQQSAIGTDTNKTAAGSINIYGGTVKGRYAVNLGENAALTLSGGPSLSGATADLCLDTQAGTTVNAAKVDARDYTGGALDVVESGTIASKEGAYAIRVNETGKDKFTLNNSDGYVYMYHTSGGLYIHKHAYSYMASGGTITESCRGCGHSATATLSAPTNLTYDGQAKTAGLSVSGNWQGGDLTVSYSENGNVSAGTVTASITAGGATAQVTYTIAKADATATPPAANTLTYNTTAQALVTAGAATGGTMQYSLSKEGEYSAAIPSETDAGDYTVWYKVAGDSNHNDTAPASVKVTIAKADPNLTANLNPSAVIDPAVTDTNSVTVTLTAAAATGGGKIEYAYSTSDTAPADGWQESTKFTGLTEGKTYYFFAKVAETKNYNSDTSNGVECETPARFNATVKLHKDGAAWADSGYAAALYQNGVEKYDLVETGGSYTVGWVLPGEYDVFVNGADTGEVVSDSTAVTVDYYTVSFDADGGENPPESQIILKGNTAAEPAAAENPTRTGYAFAEWKHGESTFHFTTPITAKTELTAAWTLNAPAVALTADKAAAQYTGKTAITLTAVPSHAVEGLTYTYQWFKDSSTVPLAGESGAALERTGVAQSGSYTVRVTAKDGEGRTSTATSAAVKAEITPKPVVARWEGLSQTYGDVQEVKAVLSGFAEGERYTAVLTFGADETTEPDDAGTYAVQAALTGDGAENYRILNPAETLTIHPAPVAFAVTENVQVYAEGVSKAAKIQSSVKDFSAYTITYRNTAGETVEEPTEAGAYAVWVEITDKNYCHTGGGTSKQVGTLTISQAEPAKYTVTFARGEGAGGQGPNDIEDVLAGTVLLLPDEDGLEKNGYAFAGWLYGGAVYQSGDAFSMPAGDVTFTAQWQAVHTVSGTVVEGADEKPLKGVTVTLMLGGKQIGDSVETKNNGTFSFDNVPSGLYNLVAQHEGITVTSRVELTDADSTDNTITMPEGMTNSRVTVVGDTPVAVVGNLDTAFETPSEGMNAVYTTTDAKTVAQGGIVEVELTASTPDADEQAEVEKTLQSSTVVNQSAALGLILELRVEKTVIPADSDTTVEPISDTGVLLDTHIPLPAELQGKDNYAVYRIHENADRTTAVQVLATGGGENTERIELNADKTVLTIHARYYSDYVLAWWDTPPSPSRPDGGSGGSATYPPDVEDTDHGAVEVSPARPGRGDTVTITPKPEEGYAVDEVTVTDRDGDPVKVTDNGDGTYSFVQPAGSVTITVTFRPADGACPRDETCPIWPFADASPTAWYHDGVHFVLERGLMNGVSPDAFRPDASTTRAMVATILWRLEGSPPVDYLLPFTDVAADTWYTEAVRWAAAEGIVLGTSATTYDPEDPITREQMAAMLYRYAQYKGYDVSVGEDTNILSYADAFDSSGYAVPALQWACGAGLLEGVGGGRLVPGGTATRSQAAVMLHRFCELDK